MTTQMLDLPFKGTRDYLHGTDFFQSACTALSASEAAPLESFEIAFHKVAKGQVEFVTAEGDAVLDPKGSCARGKFRRADGSAGQFLFLETPATPSRRIPYPEQDIVAPLKFSEDDSQATLDHAMGFTDIETWIPMIKATHDRLFPDAQGKWMFGRAKLSGYSPEHAPSSYQVVMAAALGTKLTRNDIYLGERRVGDIFFVLM